jgi:hypothetical protein
MFGILYNKTATLYWYTRDSKTKISSYKQVWTFKCTIQPLSVKDWLEWWVMFNTKKLYTDYPSLKTWQKLVIDWKTYIVWEILEWWGTLKKLFKVFINESDWT